MMGFLIFLLRLCNLIISAGVSPLQKYEILRHFHLGKFRIAVMMSDKKLIYSPKCDYIWAINSNNIAHDL